MQIQSVKLTPYRLPLKQTWKTSNISLSSRKGWLIELSGEAGLSGFGDCAPLPASGTEQPLQANNWLETQSKRLQHTPAVDALEQLSAAHLCPAARCGIETALLDLISQSDQLSLRHWLNPAAENSIAVNTMIGPLGEDSSQPALHAVGQGYQVLKLKVGLNNIQEDIRLLESLSAQLPRHILLRLDANGAWSYRQAEAFIKAINHLPVESIEEPLQYSDLSKLCRLQDCTTIVLALDESISKLKLDEIFKSQAVQRLIIKPVVRGGLLPSLALARRAASRGIETIITSTIESAIGLQAASQLAAAIPLTKSTMAHGLATSDWLSNNVAPPPEIIQGKLQLTDTHGLGLSPYKGGTHANI
ncbi:MAG: o-succinylbenzoate synthase [Pseudomonadota bacterium]|nr:o-succinylbenzoate synthase [Pseudomonadota bacterium]